MRDLITKLPAKYLMGKGIDKRFPFLVDLYKKTSVYLSSNGEEMVNLPDGSKLLVSTKDTGLGLILRNKRPFEPLQTRKMLSILKKGDSAIDIGANIGFYTIQFAKKVGKSGTVYAFEPDERNYELLKKNIKINKLQNVKVIKSAVADKDGYMNFEQDLANPGESKLTKGKNSKKIKVIKLDSFIQKEKIKNLRLIKIDVEGAEGMVLKGAQNLKRRKSVSIFLEINPNVLSQLRTNSKEIMDQLSQLGFKPKNIFYDRQKKNLRFSKKNLKKALQVNSYITVGANK